jgi:hypothetical protein
MTTTTKTLKALASKVRCDAAYGRTAKPWAEYDEWQRAAHPYRVTLRYQRRTLTTDYWMGQALTDEPDASGVLGSLLLDARIGAGSFEDYCSDFGADEDSRKEYRAWQACKRTAAKLRRFLGADFDTFNEAEQD